MNLSVLLSLECPPKSPLLPTASPSRDSALNIRRLGRRLIRCIGIRRPGLPTRLGAAGVAVSLLLGPPAFAACNVQQRADIPVTLIGGQVLAAGGIDGKPVTFLIDTGAEKTLLSDTSVKRLGLVRDEWVSSHMQGIGGYERHPNAKLDTLELGGMKLRRRGTEIDPTISVAPLPFISGANRAIDGLLGADYLSSFDISFDLRRGKMTLYDVGGCAGNFLPWTNPYVAIPVDNPVPGRLLLPIRVNGRKMSAQIDSGSTRTVMALRSALHSGLTQAVMDRDPQQKVRGVGAAELTAYEHLFSEFQVGPGDVRKLPVLIMPLPVQGGDVLLGVDWLGGQPVWISWSTNQVFVAR
jgi:predicted aspartyl protease